MDIKIYGTGTSGSQLVRDLIKHYLDLAEIKYNLSEIDDVRQFMSEEITSVPAVQVDNEAPIEVRSNGSFNNSIRNIICKLLEREDYGTIPRILVPIDFSDVSINAFNFASNLAKDKGHLLVLSHVYYPTSVDINGTVFFDADIRVQKEKILNEFVEGINQDWIGDIMKASLVTGKFSEGFPVPNLLEAAKKENAEYIVVGSTGAGSTIKHIFGSVSTELMYKADRPVFVVPPQAQYRPFDRILFSASHATEDISCIDFITEFAEKHHSILHVVHVRERSEGLATDLDYQKRWLDKYPEDKLVFDTLTGNDIAKAVNAYADENDIQLLILNPQKRSFFERIFHKSVSKKMAITCSIPLLAIHLP